MRSVAGIRGTAAAVSQPFYAASRAGSLSGKGSVPIQGYPCHTSWGTSS